MIVAPRFDGDTDDVTMGAQHEVYHKALRIIIDGCRDMTERAATLLGVDWPEGWTRASPVDHRTLQDTHDVLAAVWRFRSDSVQPSLPLGGRPAEPDCATAWLDWLLQEVRSWHRIPRRVTLVMTAISFQNRGPGYRAEDDLASELRAAHDDIPWLVPPSGRRRGI